MLARSQEAPHLDLMPGFPRVRLSKECSGRAARCRICSTVIPPKVERIMAYSLGNKARQLPNGGVIRGTRLQFHEQCFWAILNMNSSEFANWRPWHLCAHCQGPLLAPSDPPSGKPWNFTRTPPVYLGRMAPFGHLCVECRESPTYEACALCETYFPSFMVSHHREVNVCDFCAEGRDVMTPRRQRRLEQAHERLNQTLEKAKDVVGSWLS